jgi:hypothetical protein
MKLDSRRSQHRLLDFQADDADAVVVTRDGAAYGEQCFRLAAGAAPGGVAYGFAVAAQKGFGKIYECRLLHESTSVRAARAILSIRFLTATTQTAIDAV